MIISVVWLVGFLCFLIVRSLDFKKTARLFREGKMRSCATYFHRFRSKIYLPPDLELLYTAEEREMLLAHERQHIAQHDPFVYRVLVIIECACWFNPLVSVAVRHYQHERELLCDERVTRGCPKYDYGMLILKAAERRPAMRAATAGIVMEHGSISERVKAMTEPIKTVGKWTAAAIVCLTVMQIAAGLSGFRPAWRSFNDISPAAAEEMGLKEVYVFLIEDVEHFDPNEFKHGHVEGMENFMTIGEKSLTFDEAGMYDYAMSIGLTDKNGLYVIHTNAIRPTWGPGEFVYDSLAFALVSLKSEEMSIEFTPNRDFYSILTDMLI
jgi:hypothetical protein